MVAHGGDNGYVILETNKKMHSIYILEENDAPTCR